MKNTRIHQPRPQYEAYIKTLSEEFKQLNHDDHELSLDKVIMIWLGSEKCKDDIPDNLIELANK
jgi:hypothetical protein